MVAASRLGRRYVGYDLDPEYVALARRRVADEGTPDDASERGQALARGTSAVALAERTLEDAGFTITDRDRKVRRTGVAVPIVAVDGDGDEWWFDVPGAFTAYRGGLGRMDAVWRALGRAAAVRSARGTAPLVLLTAEVPRRSSEGDQALRAAGTDTVFDVVDLLSPDARERLARYAKGGAGSTPLPGFWLA